jgi:hypothetical protein
VCYLKVITWDKITFGHRSTIHLGSLYVLYIFIKSFELVEIAEDAGIPNVSRMDLVSSFFDLMYQLISRSLSRL